MSRWILALLILASFSLPIKTLAADNEPNLDELIEQTVPSNDGTNPTPTPETIPVQEPAPIAEPAPIPDQDAAPVPATEQP